MTLSGTPHRIVSLVPSQTELLFDLGLTREVVGVTRYCTRPSGKVAQVTQVGGTKKFAFDVIESLQPDLVLGNKEENYAEGIARLRERYPVWMSDIATLPDALAMIREVAWLVGRDPAGSVLLDRIESGFDQVKPVPGLRVAYLIWRQPWMVAGGQTFIDDLLQRAGFENVFAHRARYPEVTVAALQDAAPDVVLLSSEPFPFTEDHSNEFRAVLPEARIQVVDGTLFSWYGSRLRHFPAAWAALRGQLESGD